MRLRIIPKTHKTIYPAIPRGFHLANTCLSKCLKLSRRRAKNTNSDKNARKSHEKQKITKTVNSIYPFVPPVIKNSPFLVAQMSVSLSSTRTVLSRWPADGAGMNN